MYVQVIQGTCHDEGALKRQLDRWHEDLAPGADGWLGSTCGTTDTDLFVGVVRFESREAAERNSERTEQSDWWEETSRCFDGEVTFHDCDDAIVVLDGGSDDAGFVQVVQGQVEDAQRLRDLMSRPMDEMREMRPEIIGGTVAVDDSGWFSQTFAFRSEDEARQGEGQEMPAERQREWESMMSQVTDLTYLDLHSPWFASAGS